MNRIELRRWAERINVIIKLTWGVICFVSSAGWAEFYEVGGGIGYPFRFFLFLGLYRSLDITVNTRAEAGDP